MGNVESDPVTNEDAPLENDSTTDRTALSSVLARPRPGQAGGFSDEQRKRELMAAIIEQTKKNFHDALAHAGDLSRQTVGQDAQIPESSAPDTAHRMNGLMIAAEGLMRDPISMFRDAVVKLAEESTLQDPDRAAEPPSPSTPVAIPFPDPCAVVLSMHASDVAGTEVDISKAASPCRYRFVDCSSLVHERILRVLEYDDLAQLEPQTYAAVSYIWRGAIGPASLSMAQSGTLSVAGATGGDPISLDVLLHVSRACLSDEIPLLWLDRLCIMQTSKVDKTWQIQKMYGVYASCGKCYVLPGGTRRLVSLEEPTLWIHRGWTLQEAVAPKKCSVVISWPHTTATFSNPRQPLGSAGTIDVIVPGESAQAPLGPLVMASVAGVVEFRARSPDSWTGIPIDVSVRVFGGDKVGRRHAFALSIAMKAKDDARDRGSIRRKTALWRSAMMRTSSRPVDMVFSIMGLFEVTLNPKDFEADDRVGATIALAREILKQGDVPHWLTMSLALPPNPSVRSFPAFPATDVAGAAVYTVGERELEAAELMGDIDGWLGTEGLPGASMDVQGYLTFVALSVPVRRTGVRQPSESVPRSSPKMFENQILQFHDVHTPPFIVDNDGEVWEMGLSDDRPAGEAGELASETHNGDAGSKRCYVVSMGRMFTWSESRFFDSQTLARALLLEEYAEGRFARRSWFTFNKLTFHFEGWTERCFTI